MARAPRPRKKSASIISTLEQRRLKLEEEIRALEAQPESTSRDKSLATKKRLLANVDKERYNWLGLEEEEELGTKHFIKNVQAIVRQRKAGLATAIKSAVGMSILGADPMISNLWGGALVTRDLFRGRKSQDDDIPNVGRSAETGLESLTGSSDNQAEETGNGISLKPILDLLSNISTTSTKTYNLLEWVYTYRRARFREIMNLDSITDAAESTLQMESTNPPGTVLEDIRDVLIKQNTVLGNLEPTEEEKRESLMGKLRNWRSAKKSLKPFSVLAGGTAAGAAAGAGGGGFLSNLAAETGGEVLGRSLRKKGLVGKGLRSAGRGIGTIATKIGPKGLALGGLATFAVMGAMDMAKGAMHKHKTWGKSRVSSGVGALLGGTGSGFKNAFAGFGKWGGLGVKIGAVGGPMGMIAGGLIGGSIGAILGVIGGEKIAGLFDTLGKWLYNSLWMPLYNFGRNLFGLPPVTTDPNTVPPDKTNPTQTRPTITLTPEGVADWKKINSGVKLNNATAEKRATEAALKANQGTATAIQTNQTFYNKKEENISFSTPSTLNSTEKKHVINIVTGRIVGE